jgi:hypothetical protein
MELNVHGVLVFRGKRGDLSKILRLDGLGLSLTSRPRGNRLGGMVPIRGAQPVYLLDGIDWRVRTDPARARSSWGLRAHRPDAGDVPRRDFDDDPIDARERYLIDALKNLDQRCTIFATLAMVGSTRSRSSASRIPALGNLHAV